MNFEINSKNNVDIQKIMKEGFDLRRSNTPVPTQTVSVSGKASIGAKAKLGTSEVSGGLKAQGTRTTKPSSSAHSCSIKRCLARTRPTQCTDAMENLQRKRVSRKLLEKLTTIWAMLRPCERPACWGRGIATRSLRRVAVVS